jgi:predicted nucleotidyltransferase
LLSLYERNVGRVRRFAGSALKKWCKEQSLVHPLTVREAEALYARTWNKGIFENTPFSVHPVKVEGEVQSGIEIIKSKGLFEVSASVVDSSDSLFLPATYLVADVRPEGEFSSISKVVSYEGLYGDIAGKDDRIMVRGKIEDVFDALGKLQYRRILVGSPEACGSDFIKVKNRS